MVTRAKKIDPVQVCAIALRNVKTKADYNRIGAANSEADLQAAWQTLSESEQNHIHAICNREPEPDINALAAQITACDNILQLQALKARYGEETIKGAWRLIPAEERRRLKTICDGQPPEEAPVTEHPVDTLTQTVERVEPKPRTLFSISTDLEKLNELLDECGDDAQQQELINNWLEQLGDERDRKLDNYCALITEMMSRAAARKAEAQRMMELAQVDENRARLLKDRLKWFFESHNLKTIETARYKLSLQRNGGKAPLILKEGLSPTELPERFQKVSVDPDTTAIRQALEAGEHLDFAALGERGRHIVIR